MEQITVGAVRFRLGHRYGDVMFARIVDQSRPRIEIPQPPRRDDFDAGPKRIVSQLEAHLIVALTGGAVRNRVGFFFDGDVDLSFGD